MVSLPERVLRSAAALAGGLIRELGDVALPAAVRRTKSYQMMVEIALRFLIEQKSVTQAQAATGAGIAESTISEVLAGKRKLNRTQIAKLARYFHVATGAFLAKA